MRWHKLSEVDNECTLNISIILAIRMPKIIKFGGDSTKFWQKKVGSFLAHPVYIEWVTTSSHVRVKKNLGFSKEAQLDVFYCFWGF